MDTIEDIEKKGVYLKEVKSNTAYIRLREDGILEITPLKWVGNTEKLEDAIRNVEIVEELSKRKKMPILGFLSVSIIHIEARRYYASRQPNTTPAVALVAKNSVHKVIGNFFIGINKLPVPTKIFSDPKEAEKWLKTFL